MRIIHSASGRFRVNDASWAMVLRLAYIHEWRPRGTLEPEGWQGVASDGVTPRLWNARNYWSRRGQRVTDEDARAMSEALETALPDIPDHDAVAHKVVSIIDFPDRPAWRFLNPFRRINPYEYFSGAGKARLSRFIGFCAQSGFTIGGTAQGPRRSGGESKG